MNIHEIKKAYGYVRVSSNGQVDHDGFTRQETAIRVFADRNGISLRKVYQDAWTGTEQDRPELTDLLEEIEQSGVMVIIVERMDRVARDVVVSELIIRDLQKLGITLIEAESGLEMTDGVENLNPTRKLIRQVLGAVAEFDKDSLVHKLREARKRKAKKLGRKTVEGRKPYGYHVDPDTARQERKILGILLSMYSRMRNTQIAEELNRQGYRTRMGRKWTSKRVKDICEAEEARRQGA